MEIRGAWIADLAKILILALLLLSLFSSLVLAMTIRSEFSCTNTGAETTFYTYLKSPGVQESAYSTGLKTGSSDYYNGSKDKESKAYIFDSLDYYDGKMDALHSYNPNASITHHLDIDFSGDPRTSRGISSFYGQGFYGDNRGISASKHFWFNTKNSYPTNNISANASAIMDLGGDYDLNYHANANNAYFVFNDATGFSNKTGMSRIDWEQEGLLKGKNIDVTNNLHGIFKSRAGADDWLPCTCLSGLIPPVEPIASKLDHWPSWQAEFVLKPLNLQLVMDDAAKYGYGAALWLNNSNSAGAGKPITYQNLQNLPQVELESYYKTELGKNNMSVTQYTIIVRNLGSVDIDDALLVHKLADGTSYIPDSSTINDWSQAPSQIVLNKYITWALGRLNAGSGPGSMKTVVMQVNSTNSLDPGSSTAYMMYRVGSQSMNTTSVKTQNPVAHTAF